MIKSYNNGYHRVNGQHARIVFLSFLSYPNLFFNRFLYVQFCSVLSEEKIGVDCLLAQSSDVPIDSTEVCSFLDDLEGKDNTEEALHSRKMRKIKKKAVTAEESAEDNEEMGDLNRENTALPQGEWDQSKSLLEE